MKTAIARTLIALVTIAIPFSALWGADVTPLPDVADEPSEPESPAVGNKDAPADDDEPSRVGSRCGCGACESDPCDDSCCSCGGRCRRCRGCVTGCDEDPQIGVVGLFGFDSFHGVSDGSYQSNFGTVAGVNGAVPIPWLYDYGVAAQIGATYGVYDWKGRSSSFQPLSSQQQTFVTTGLFRRAFDGRRLSFGLVYDWMVGTNWGTFATGPVLGQWRGQAECALSDCDSLGVWGTMRDHGHGQVVPAFVPASVETRALSQINFFWHHKFTGGADSGVWVGIPQSDRLGQPGNLGDLILGGDVQVPLSDQVALYANLQYMKPSASAGHDAAIDETYNIGVGLAWYPGRYARTKTVNGACWMPYMPVANNSTFLVDQFPAF
jgi:hypothetical protein